MEEEIIYFYNVKDGKYYQSRYTHRWLNNLQQQCKKQKEVINKLSKIIYEIDDLRKTTGGYPSHYLDELLDVLKEVSK